MTEGFYLIDAHKIAARIGLVVIALAALAFAWFSIKWQIGSLLAELTPPSQSDANQISKYAIAFSPSNAQAWWLASTTEKDLFTPEKIDASVRLSEQAVRLSPNDFRLWAELGRSYEQAAEVEKAQIAFEQATELAPTYAYPHWQLGNFFIRQSRAEEALIELKKTTIYDTTYRDQAYSLVWNYFDNDPKRLDELAADSLDAKLGLAQFFAWHGRPVDALRVWNSLDQDERASSVQAARSIAEAMNEKRSFWEGIEFAREARIDRKAAVETINNGSFEDPIVESDETLYGWKVNQNDNRAEITADSRVWHTGTLSLRVIFRTYLNPNFYSIWQNVAVKPATRYRLRFWVRTDGLKSGGPPIFEVANASDDKIIAVSSTIPTGTTEWQEVMIDFTTPDQCGGLYVRSSRSFCGPDCPLVGTMWLDDFELIKG